MGVFTSEKVTTSIVNRYSAGSLSDALAIAANTGAKEILSGALTADTFATALSISGAGWIDLLYIYTKDATARTIGLKLTLDGTIVFNAVSNAISAGATGMMVVGHRGYDSAAAYWIEKGNQVYFSTSCLVEIKSSLLETDKIAIGEIHRLAA